MKVNAQHLSAFKEINNIDAQKRRAKYAILINSRPSTAKSNENIIKKTWHFVIIHIQTRNKLTR